MKKQKESLDALLNSFEGSDCKKEAYQRQLQELEKMHQRFRGLEEQQGAIYSRIVAFEERLKAVRSNW